MPPVVNEQTNSVELPSYLEWSWPDHPESMSDTDARMRCARGLAERPTPDAPLQGTELAVAYGELLAEGKARIQQATYTGDNLPRDTYGGLLEVKQQMAADIAERRNGLGPGVYDTSPVYASREPGPLPNRYGAVDHAQLATWLPSEERPDIAIKAVRHHDAARTSLNASNIASCVGHDLNDNGDAWRDAISRGRNVSGLPSAVLTAADRAPSTIHVERNAGTKKYSISTKGDEVTVNAPASKGNRRADVCEELYAKARGTVAAAYGEPHNETEHAMDALVASIVTSRGTNSAGQGWAPPERDRLRTAGVELQKSPERLADIQKQVDVVEKLLYPPWPGRDMERLAERVEPGRQKDVFDYDRERYAEKHAEFGERNSQPRANLESAPEPRKRKQVDQSETIIGNTPPPPPHERPEPMREHQPPTQDRGGMTR